MPRLSKPALAANDRLQSSGGPRDMRPPRTNRLLVVLTIASLAACSRQLQSTPQVPTAARVESQRGYPSTERSHTVQEALLSQASAEHPEVKWDESSLVTADLDGDGQPDQAALGYVGEHFVVVIGKSTRSGTFKTQFLMFGINGQDRDATCGPTINLDVLPLRCAVVGGGDKLPGCAKYKSSASLSAGSGECDPIHLYWNHDHDQVVWWRE